MSKEKKVIKKIIKNSIELGDDCVESWEQSKDLEKAKVGLAAYNVAIRAIRQKRDLI
jgi:hypothetical protein